MRQPDHAVTLAEAEWSRAALMSPGTWAQEATGITGDGRQGERRMVFDGLRYKAGDKVVQISGHGDKRIVVIDKVTPTGVVVVGNARYGREGTLHRSRNYCRSQLVDITPEIEEEIRREQAIRVIRAFFDKRNEWALKLVPSEELEPVLRQLVAIVERLEAKENDT